MAKIGRPLIEINRKLFEAACKLHCPRGEIASVLECSVDTIDRWCMREYGETFAVVQKKYEDKGKFSFRRSQFKLAERNANMSIWLGKQYLGQRDEVTMTAPPEGITLKVVDCSKTDEDV